MHVGRLRERAPSAESIEVAELSNHQLMFNKRGRDGSGKCNLIARNASCVYGVVYRIDIKQWRSLDRAEGSGYGRRHLIVNGLSGGRPYRAFLYLAKTMSIDDALQPYDWYRNFVVLGAEQHGLPKTYVAQLWRVPVRGDPNGRRSRTQFNIMKHL